MQETSLLNPISYPRLAAEGIKERIFNANKELPARWRWLNRLAMQGNDGERQLEFHAREMSTAVLAGDWPLPLPHIWRGKAWRSFYRFWFSCLYWLLSDYGRSLVRPFIAWLLCTVIFAVYFLGQNAEMATQRKKYHRGGIYGQAITYSTIAAEQVRKPGGPYCYPGTLPKPEVANAQDKRPDDVQTGFSGLVEEVRAKTNLVNEALSIAYHNAVIVLDSSGDSMHRAYGCLYGIERYGGNPVAYVPRNVAIASGIQKMLSAIFIFLFGLALRNMLKVK